MIIKFVIKNFRSIVDLVLDMTYGAKRAPNGFQDMVRMPFIESYAGGPRCVPCMALWGANAAGKSNIIKALSLLRNILSPRGEGVVGYYDGNLIVPCGDNTTFELTFVVENRLLCYELTYGLNGIAREKLTSEGQLVFQLEGNTYNLEQLVSAGYGLDRIQNIIEVECMGSKGAGQIRPLLSVLGFRYHGLNKDVAAAFGFFARMDVWGDLDVQTVFPLAVDILSDEAGITKEKATDRIVSIVRKLDVDVLDITMAENPHKDERRMELYDFRTGRDGAGEYDVVIHSRHKNINGEDVYFRFMKHESEGTKRLATLVGFILAALEKGALVCIDELDWALHPLVVREMISMFMRKDMNPKGAQLIFTTHMTDLLEDGVLRMSEICLVNKNKYVGTKARRLVDIKNSGEDIRNVTNFRKQYLDGYYQAIPHPAL